jgi:hypothetical protein
VAKENAMPSIRTGQRRSRRCTDGAARPRDTAHDEFFADAAHSQAGDLIDQTIAIWQPRTERRLTREDGREIIENIAGFFTILQEWERKERAAQPADLPAGRRARRDPNNGASAIMSNVIKDNG